MFARKVKHDFERRKNGFTYINTGDLVRAPWLHFRISDTSISYKFPQWAEIPTRVSDILWVGHIVGSIDIIGSRSRLLISFLGYF